MQANLPGFITMIGLLRANPRAALMNFLASTTRSILSKTLARRGIVAQEIDEVAEVDIDHGAEGDEYAEADAGLESPLQHGAPQLAALGDERDVPRLGVRPQDTRVEPYFAAL